MPVKAFLAAVAMVAVAVGMILPNPHASARTEPQSSQLQTMQVGSR